MTAMNYPNLSWDAYYCFQTAEVQTVPWIKGVTCVKINSLRKAARPQRGCRQIKPENGEFGYKETEDRLPGS
jgi:hypothetical protein